MPKRELVMYSRSTGCPYITLARRVLDRYAVPHREIMIDRDPVAKQRVLDWTGFLSVPTLVIAESGSDLPYTDVLPLSAGASPRGIDRGPMLTEGSMEEVENWLRKHDLITD
jgi:glutaredoxin